VRETLSRSAVTKIHVTIMAVVIIAVTVGIYYYKTLPTTPNTIELTVANISYQSNWIQQKIESEWNAKHPDIHVTYLPLADYYTEIVNIFTSTPEKVDIVRTNPGYMAAWADAGWITNIDDLEGFNDTFSKVEPSRRFELLYNGKHYGLPTYTGYMAILLYNERYLQQAGFDHPPETLDEFLQQCLAIKNQGIMEYPMAWHLKGSERRIDWAWYEFTLMKGGETLYDDNWNPTYLNPGSPGYESLQFIVDCIHKYKIMDQAAVEWDTFKVVDMLMKGDCVFAPADPFHLPNVNDPETSAEAGNIKMALMPQSHYTWVKTDQFSITKACRDKGAEYYEAAWKFLRWFCGPDNNSLTYMYAKEALTMHTCYTSLNNDPTLRATWSQFMNVSLIDEQAEFAQSLQDFSPAHKTKFYLPWVNDYLIPNLQAAILQTKTVDDALHAIHQGFETLAMEYGLPER